MNEHELKLPWRTAPPKPTADNNNDECEIVVDRDGNTVNTPEQKAHAVKSANAYHELKRKLETMQRIHIERERAAGSDKPDHEILAEAYNEQPTPVEMNLERNERGTLTARVG